MDRRIPTRFRTLARAAGILAAVLLAAASVSATPTLVGYQGAVFDAQGAPAAGPVQLEVAVYDAATGGSELYRESHADVELVDGAFDVQIGGGTDKVGTFDAGTFASDGTWLELTVDGEVMDPRQQLVAVPYAMRAAVAESLDGSIGTVPHALVADALSTAYGAGGSGTALSINTDEDGTPYDDGARVHFDNDYFGTNLDALVFEKNDLNDSIPDGGIAFAYRRSDGSRSSSMVIRGGAVGIGVEAPLAYRLHVAANTGAGGTTARIENIGAGRALEVVGSGGWSDRPSLYVENKHADGRAGKFVANSSQFAATFANQGSGVGVWASNNGQGAEKAALVAKNFNPVQGMAGYFWNESNFATTHLENDGNGQVLYLQNDGASNGGWVDGTSAYIVGVDQNGWRRFWIDASGMAHVRALEILGGADLSEHFDVTAPPEAPVEPGTVVSIDPENPGELAVSARAYDTAVAGIVAGAGGIEPGMLMGQEGHPMADGAHPVALTGRVYAKADVSGGPIRPGDLLTTSDRPGHAMRAADRERAGGAILGKAMTGLDEETGLVLVLVNLQ